MTDIARESGRSALLEKFRDREERYRRDQSLHAHAESSAHSGGETPEGAAEGDASPPAPGEEDDAAE